MLSRLIKKLNESRDTYADRTAIWVKGQHYTYQELFDKSLQFSRIFNNAVKTPSRCAILSHRNIFAYQSILGSIFSGHAFMPLNPEVSLERNAKMILQGEPAILCIDIDNFEKAISLLRLIPAMHIFTVNDVLRKALKKSLPKHHYLDIPSMEVDQVEDILVEEGSDLYLLFTSGSTGEPKGIAIKHQQLNAYLDSVCKLIEPTSSDRFLQFSELTFDLSMHDIFMCWVAGASLYVFPETYLLGVKKFIQTHKITHWMSVPSNITVLSQIKQLEKGCFPSLRKSFFCGETLLKSQADQWRLAAPQSDIINFYGPTEATIAYTYFIWNDLIDDALPCVPIGIPFADQDACLVNHEGKKIPEGEAGELCLSGTQVITAYWKNPVNTLSCFQQFDWDVAGRIWYRTGDIVRWSKKYGYIFCGRKDDQWKINGYRVEKLEIEYELRKIAGHDGVAVQPVKTEQGHICGIIAFVTAPMDKDQFIRLARERLPDMMVPKKIIFLDTLPKNANGKIDYLAMKES